jgi:predicted transcriptional regulator/transcriptional regulator with XRE-family HTH domain
VQNLTGLKLRAKRKEAGLTQGELARRAGISASYLNLIEQSKRRIAGGLVDRLARGLGVDRSELDGEAERRVVQALVEVATDPRVSILESAPESAEELVGRYPGWAALVLRLYQAVRERDNAVLALADRLNRDPFLSDSVHRVLTHVTAIRSASEIMSSDDDLTPAEQRRFLSIVSSGSLEVANTARALADFFASAHTRVRSATPVEHVDAFIAQSENHFPDLEELAAAFNREWRRHGRLEAAVEALAGDPRDAALAAPGDGPSRPEARRFALVKAAARDPAQDAIERIVRGHASLPSEEARGIASAALHSYVAAAILMPYEAFLEAAERYRYDLDRLGAFFGCSYEQVAHRLVTLRRPGAQGVRFAFMRSDPAGFVTKRLPLPRLPLPRYGTACPMWVAYTAFQTPGVTVRSFGELPAGDQFLFFARAIDKRTERVGRPRHLLSVMLACDANEAPRVIYSEGIERSQAMLPVGTTCRLCRRAACGHRQEAALIAQ